MVIKAPLQQWDLNFIGPIDLASSTSHTYIITGTDYFTKWVEAKTTKKLTFEVVSKFIKENILVSFGMHIKILMDKKTYFYLVDITKSFFEYIIIVSHSSNYFPQGNSQASSINKNLVNIMKRMVLDNQRTWNKRIHEALWADRVAPKREIKISNFKLVYGTKYSLPLPLELATRKIKGSDQG